MPRLSLSVPEHLYRQLETVRKTEKAKRSRIVAEALQEYLPKRLPPDEQERPRAYPTVLWKLRLRGGVALRSPSLAQRRMKERWVVEAY